MREVAYLSLIFTQWEIITIRKTMREHNKGEFKKTDPYIGRITVFIKLKYATSLMHKFC